MKALIEQGQWLGPFVVPAITGAFALFGSWFGMKLGKATEHNQWLRNERLEAYAAFLEANEAVQRTMSDTPYGRKTPEDVYRAIDSISLQRLELLGSPATKAAANQFGGAMLDLGDVYDPIPPDLSRLPAAKDTYYTTLEELIECMAKDLKLKRSLKNRL